YRAPTRRPSGFREGEGNSPGGRGRALGRRDFDAQRSACGLEGKTAKDSKEPIHAVGLRQTDRRTRLSQNGSKAHRRGSPPGFATAWKVHGGMGYELSRLARVDAVACAASCRGLFVDHDAPKL